MKVLAACNAGALPQLALHTANPQPLKQRSHEFINTLGFKDAQHEEEGPEASGAFSNLHPASIQSC